MKLLTLSEKTLNDYKGPGLSSMLDERKHDSIDRADFGEHSMIVYPTLDAFREIYCMYAKSHLESNNEILLIVTQYETVGNVRQTLLRYGVDVERHERDGALAITDSVRGYQGADVNGIIKLAKVLVARAEKEGKKGLCAFGDMGSFFMFDRVFELLRYELSIPPRLGIKLKGFCCYHVDDYNKLAPEQKEAIENNHCRRIMPENLLYLIFNSRGGVNRAKILDLIRFHPANANQIASRLMLDYKTVIHHLSALSKYGLVMADGEEYGVTYFLTPVMEKNYASFQEILARLGFPVL